MRIQGQCCIPVIATEPVVLYLPQGLSAFPFGRVRCQLELGSWSYGPWYVNMSMQGKVRQPAPREGWKPVS
jgi:hypothetical protein